MAKADPPLIAAALARKILRVRKLVEQGVDIDTRDAAGLTALARLAIRALPKRVVHWVSEGHHGTTPVSYTVTDGVMVFRKNNRVVKMSVQSQWTFSKQWCPAFFAYLREVEMCCALINNGASLAVELPDGTTVREHLEALAHPRIDEAIENQSATLAKRAAAAEADKRRAEASARRAEASKRRMTRLTAKWRKERKAAQAKTKTKTKTKTKRRA